MAKRKTKKNKKNKPQQRQALGVLLLGLGVLLFLALISFNPNDPAQLSIGQGNLDVHNWLGPLGASLSYSLMQWTLGYPIIVLPILLFGLALNMMRGKRFFNLGRLTWNFSAWAVLLSVFLAMPEAIKFSGHILEYYPSGLVGGWLAGELVLYAGKFGSLAILFVLTVVLFVYSVHLELSGIFNRLSGSFAWVSENLRQKRAERKERRQQKKERKRLGKEESIPSPLLKTDPIPAEPEPFESTEAFRDEIPEINVDEPAEAPPDPEAESQNSLVETSESDGVQASIDDILAQLDEGIKPEKTAGVDFEVKEEVQNKELDYDRLVKESIARYKFPSVDLLADPPASARKVSHEELRANAQTLETKLMDYGVQAKVLSVTAGPVITLYELQPAKGVKVRNISNLANDLALAMEAKAIRILAPIPGKAAVGVEIPNRNPQIVYLKSLIRSSRFSTSGFKLPLALGKAINGEVYVADLSKMPHLLIAGATGSGKSVGINTIIMSLVYAVNPAKVKFMMVDPKKLELSLYRSLRDHYLLWRPDLDEEIITQPKNAVSMLNSMVLEMERRYDCLADLGVRSIEEYNEKLEKVKGTFKGKKHHQLPFLIVIIDELSDLMVVSAKEVETPIARLAQMARAVGIHLIVATQRPSVNVITGVIKANFPARIAYKTRSRVDSRTILDIMGAEKLLGNGDMLYLPPDLPNPIRLQNPLVTTGEVQAVIDHIAKQAKLPSYSLPQPEASAAGGLAGRGAAAEDPFYKDALAIVVQHRQASTSLLQRRLGIGYSRAARLMDRMEAEGIIGPKDASKPREVLISAQELNNLF